jgi:hypothetical protein
MGRIDEILFLLLNNFIHFVIVYVSIYAFTWAIF